VELRQLRYFVEIAGQGSFTKAAEILAIAQPALTAQIHKLEAEFNAQLFVRSKRGVALTVVGRVVLEQAQRTLDAADATKRSAELASSAASARLIVGFTRIFPFFRSRERSAACGAIVRISRSSCARCGRTIRWMP
jgi:DNA-binding transcriptional LysR family regulator